MTDQTERQRAAKFVEILLDGLARAFGRVLNLLFILTLLHVFGLLTPLIGLINSIAKLIGE